MFIDTKKIDVNNLADLLNTRTHSSPDKVIYSFLNGSDNVEKSITYNELKRHVSSVNNYLAHYSEKNDRIALLFPQCSEFLYAFWGCVSSGRIAIPLPPPRMSHLQETLNKIKAIIDSATPTIILTTPEIKRAIDEFPKALNCLSDIIWLAVEDTLQDQSDEPLPIAPVAPDDIAMLQYTSGSTSLPKGVVLTHHNLLNNIKYFEQAMVHGPESKVLTWLPPFHDLGLIYGLLTPVYADIACYIMPGPVFAQQPSRWIQAISDFRITHTAAPNFSYDLARKSVSAEQLARLDLSSWVTALNGGEPVRAKTMEEFSDFFAPAGFDKRVFNPCWGLAEASCIVTGTHNGSPSSGIDGRSPPRVVIVDRSALAEGMVVSCDQSAAEALTLCSSGSALLDTQLAIVDPESHVPVAANHVGEVWVANQAVSSGYWMQPDKSALTFGWSVSAESGGNAAQPHRYMRTGDLGFLLDGQLFVTGRIKDTVIIRGRCHYPQDIEAVLEAVHPQIRQGSASVFALQSDEQEVVAAVIEVSRHFKVDKHATEIFGLLRRAIADECGLQLSAITLIATGTLPRTTSGKVQRAKAKQQFIDQTLSVKAQWVMPELAKQLAADKQALEPQPPQSNEKKPTHSADTSSAEKQIRSWLTTWIASTSGLAEQDILPHLPFSDFGLDSSSVVLLSGNIAQHFGLSKVPPGVAYDFPTLDTLSRYIATQCASNTADNTSPRMTKPAAERNTAIIGMACSVPGAKNLSEYWSLITSGQCSVGIIPPARHALLQRLGSAVFEIPGGYLDNIDQFDPAFFNISPREAEQIDPQQRLLLQTVWHAFEHAGLTRETLDGSRTGVFVAICATDYATLCAKEDIALDGHAGAGLASSIAANRLSYYFNLTGPSMVIDTACSSSLVAVYQAVQSLERGECDRAVVAGVNLILHTQFSHIFLKAGMLSPTARCHSFDKTADGYVRSEGVAAIILTRATIAQLNKHRILAWIAGSAVNQDGRSFGLTAPNGVAQRAVMHSALASAGIDATEVKYVEAHGTGTVLGDAIEYSALADVYGGQHAAPCKIGAVKANIGHLEAVAGLAGLIKVVLCLQEQQVPPIAGFKQLNPTFPLAEGLQFNAGATEHFDFEYGGVTSMGFGGTNAHVIVQRAAAVEKIALVDGPRVLPLGAVSASSLASLAAASVEQLRAAPQLWQHLASAASQYRSVFPYRLAVVASSANEMIDALQAQANIAAPSPVHRPPRTALVFSGQGIQQVDMGREWYQRIAVFRQKIDECDALLKARCAVTVRELFDGSLSDEQVKKRIAHTADAQLMIASCELALAAWLEDCGLIADCVFGHSLGEYVAAHVAGALTLSDTLYLIHTRGQAMNAAPDGRMLAVRTSSDVINALITQHQLDVEVAAINSADDVTISGTPEGISALATLCETQGLTAIALDVAKAFHSASMNDAAQLLEKAAAEVSSYPTRITLLANLQGDKVSEVDAAHWARHLRETVQFKNCVENALAESCTLLVEIGGRALQPFLRKLAQGNADVVALAAGKNEWDNALTTVARLYTAGLSINWSAIYTDEQVSPDVLPAYPFDQQSYWLDKTPGVASTDNVVPLHPVTRSQEETQHQAAGNTQHVLTEILGHLLKLRPEQVDPSRSFFDLGADSILLIEMASIIDKRLGVKVTVPQLFGQYKTLTALTGFIELESASAVQENSVSTLWADIAVNDVAAASYDAPSIVVPHILPPVTNTAALQPTIHLKTAPAAPLDAYQALFQQQLDSFRSLVDAQLTFLKSHPQAVYQPPHPVAGQTEPHFPSRAPLQPQIDLRHSINNAALAGFNYALAVLYQSKPQHLALSVDDLGQLLGVQPHRLQLWRQLCAHLATTDTLDIEQNKVVAVRLAESQSALAALEHRLDMYRQASPDAAQAELCSSMLLRCARELPAVLTGEKLGTDVLFCENGMQEIAALYQSAPGTEEVHNALSRSASQALAQTSSHQTSRHILEVGAGTGTTAKLLLPTLTQLPNIDPRYLFTDISHAFLNRARHAFAEWPCVEFAIFDLERHIDEQQLNGHKFDLIVAANVVHTTLDLSVSLDQLQRRLNPNGAILLVECIEQQPWLDLVFGLTDGWWRYTDSALRQKGPLLDEETWRGLLTVKGWQDIEITTFAQTQALIYARYH